MTNYAEDNGSNDDDDDDEEDDDEDDVDDDDDVDVSRQVVDGKTARGRGENKVPQGYIRCDFFIVTHHIIAYDGIL